MGMRRALFSDGQRVLGWIFLSGPSVHYPPRFPRKLTPLTVTRLPSSLTGDEGWAVGGTCKVKRVGEDQSSFSAEWWWAGCVLLKAVVPSARTLLSDSSAHFLPPSAGLVNVGHHALEAGSPDV